MLFQFRQGCRNCYQAWRVLVLNYSQIEDLLSDTALLLGKLSKLDHAVNKVKDVSHSLAQVCSDLQPKHNLVAQDVERLRRLQEVLQGFVFGQITPATPSTEDAPPTHVRDPLMDQIR